MDDLWKELRLTMKRVDEIDLEFVNFAKEKFKNMFYDRSMGYEHHYFEYCTEGMNIWHELKRIMRDDEVLKAREITDQPKYVVKGRYNDFEILYDALNDFYTCKQDLDHAKKEFDYMEIHRIETVLRVANKCFNNIERYLGHEMMLLQNH